MAALPLSDHRERFAHLRTVTVAGRQLDVENAWWHQDRLILKFRGIDTISDAEPLAGADVEIAPQERRQLDDDEYFLSDLVGCNIVDAHNGNVIGVVESWDETGGPVLLEVRRPGSDDPMLVPFVRAICTDINVDDKRIAVNLPEGLAELNTP